MIISCFCSDLKIIFILTQFWHEHPLTHLYFCFLYLLPTHQTVQLLCTSLLILLYVSWNTFVLLYWLYHISSPLLPQPVLASPVFFLRFFFCHDFCALSHLSIECLSVFPRVLHCMRMAFLSLNHRLEESHRSVGNPLKFSWLRLIIPFFLIPDCLSELSHPARDWSMILCQLAVEPERACLGCIVWVDPSLKICPRVAHTCLSLSVSSLAVTLFLHSDAYTLILYLLCMLLCLTPRTLSISTSAAVIYFLLFP